ncbi:Inactive Tyrosine-Protein Kinase Peak1 [Manis pentadactyla]|nr:Inactive Tyrosine-Protein Kinase Peak1 [Manis pentadactyla]
MRGLGVKERLLKYVVQQIGVLVQLKGKRSEGYSTVERPLECEIDAAKHSTTETTTLGLFYSSEGYIRKKQQLGYTLSRENV